jgi:hypothetical protein
VSTPTDYLASEGVAALLVTATRLVAAELELVDELDPDLRSSLLMLAVALSQLEERRGLELELEAEGVRVPVAVVAGEPGEPLEQSWGWAAHVEAVIAAADQVVDRVLSPAAQTIPAHELVSFDRLCNAVLAHRDHPTLAERWREMGGTLSIVELEDRAPVLADDLALAELERRGPELDDDL